MGRSPFGPRPKVDPLKSFAGKTLSVAQRGLAPTCALPCLGPAQSADLLKVAAGPEGSMGGGGTSLLRRNSSELLRFVRCSRTVSERSKGRGMGRGLPLPYAFCPPQMRERTVSASCFGGVRGGVLPFLVYERSEFLFAFSWVSPSWLRPISSPAFNPSKMKTGLVFRREPARQKIDTLSRRRGRRLVVIWKVSRETLVAKCLHLFF